jgi:propanediol dehydratase small subunit
MLSVVNTINEVGSTSAALPTMGTRINPTKVSDIPLPSTSPSMLSTRNSAQTATMTVETMRLDINVVTDRGFTVQRRTSE